MFAEDITFYFENKSAKILNLVIKLNFNCQTDLKYINKWLIYNRLLLYKTCYILINLRIIININLNNINIERLNFIKY